MPKGTIRMLRDSSYGFIKSEEGKDLFFHRSQLQGVDFNSLSEEQAVEFEIGKGQDGRPQAVKVRLAEPEGE
jgi:CspA family cold shock protein